LQASVPTSFNKTALHVTNLDVDFLFNRYAGSVTLAGGSASVSFVTAANTNYVTPQTFADGTFVLGTMDGRSWYAQAQSGAHVIVGEWIMTSSSAVPLPGALWLLLSGMGAVGLAKPRG